MSLLQSHEGWKEFLVLLQETLQRGVTTEQEETVREATLEWLSQHGLETFQHYDVQDRPVPPMNFVYRAGSPYAVQLELHVSHDGKPVTLIVGDSPNE